jgi:pimeloyl-ACP methyl ester carboxylesterase
MTIRYARSGSAHIAYDTLGVGPIDLLHISPGIMVPIDALEDEPRVARYYRRLASFARVIHFDPRGLGRSDPLDPQRPNSTSAVAEDAVAVLDAAGSTSAVLVGWFGGGPVAVEVAAAHPERVSSLVLLDTYARMIEDDDYPGAHPRTAPGREPVHTTSLRPLPGRAHRRRQARRDPRHRRHAVDG